ncbi:uncharacterized protein LAJ45_08701 [Morchella importuna]|uniref:uncharacterized protein n=1 Tax=Morchella importuna TaxID=1174673 RepID=UPI001E8CDDE7|nr:uncharacterized protein LAJ45_08701 [Morchella importuna]KAH8147223.1 hypothetical protein LAJ45_08701 [Morchella importuna]
MSGGSCVIQYYNYPGVGIRNRQYLNYSQACRAGDNIECAGQGSWNPLNGLQDPQLPRRHGRCVLGGRDQELAEVVSGHGPLWTALGVEKLAEEGMVVEIEAEAYGPR